MKKTLTIAALLVLSIKVMDDIFLDLPIVILSHETLAYKSGYIFGFLLLLLCIVCLSVQVYEMFFKGKSKKSPQVL